MYKVLMRSPRAELRVPDAREWVSSGGLISVFRCIEKMNFID